MKPFQNPFVQPHHSLNCRGRLFSLEQPKIMGILNITPDSFSDGGLYSTGKDALLRTEKMLAEGAEIIDIGAQSTRPGAQFLPCETEMLRLGHIISKIKKEFPEAIVSVDTFWSGTAKFACDEGADIINDISAGQFDEKMFETVARTGLPYILMHSNFSYESMHDKINYADITCDLNRFFSAKTAELVKLGINDIILDPGFGFGKKVEDQLRLLDEAEFIGLGAYPLLIGISRKSFIYKPLAKSPLDINEETQKLHLKALEKGTKILRVHDVAETKKTVDFFLTSKKMQKPA